MSNTTIITIITKCNLICNDEWSLICINNKEHDCLMNYCDFCWKKICTCYDEF